MRTFLVKTPVSGYTGKVGVLAFEQGEALLQVPEVDPDNGQVLDADDRPTGTVDDDRLGTFAYVQSQGYTLYELDEEGYVVERDADGEIKEIADDDIVHLDDISVRYRSSGYDLVDLPDDAEAPVQPLIGDPAGAQPAAVPTIDVPVPGAVETTKADGKPAPAKSAKPAATPKGGTQ